ncbi:MAG TPA: phosphoglucosamine mutase, partial [Rhodopila sp.]|nr:phosphoglucosamine mutase [Rhodopila sp.]
IADENGEVVDGDQILALIAHSWHRAGTLLGGGIVATVMSNLGLERHVTGLGLRLHRTNVGDRYVAEHMRAAGINVGGEQSGHLILSDFATTGDGLLAALQVLGVLVQQNRPASEVLQVFRPLPQRLKNVRFAGVSPLREERVQAAIRGAEARLNGTGRVLIRESGTEPLVRVMAEGEDSALVAEVVDSLCELIAEVARVREAVL